MTDYKAPLDDIRFALHDLLGGEGVLTALQGGGEHSRELLDAVLEEAARFNEQVLAPLNAVGDQQGCRFDKATASVTTPAGFKEAYRTYVEGGWAGLTMPEALGGQGLPEVLGVAMKEMLDAANMAWGNYPLLSQGAAHALQLHGDDWHKEVFLKPMVEGRWCGSMCLTEPQAGSDLGLLKTRAEPGADGSYLLTGTKIFITAGEHDLTDNIVHLVLARLPDAPAGSRGISLFVVPKFKVGRDGAMGERNAVHAGAIEHKMGIHGSPTCVMNFDGAEGWLIGEPHRGLFGMFTMMNAARLAVGVQGVGLAERAMQASFGYAHERLQGRALGGPVAPDKPADPLIVHPDIRRMLLTQRAIVEGGRALALYAALQLDIEERAEDEAARTRAGELVAFLIPIVKGVLTELAQESVKEALQVYGGHGYIAENAVEQYVRDARIITLYEGTTGIQAMDLLGRKILQLKGVGLKHFLEEIGGFCARHARDEALAPFVGPLGAMAKEWQELTMDVVGRVQGNPEELGAAAVDYLYYAGYVALAYMWARAVAALEGSGQTEAFKQAKRDTARFYFARLLPRCAVHRAAVGAGVDSLALG